MTILFGRTQSASDTPFEPNRNPGFGGVPSEISSNNVQDAIEEAKLDALNNDRFILLCSYNGNANVGRYLEFFPNIDSLTAPIFLAASSRCLSLVIASSALHTASIGFFDLNISTVTPIYTASYVNQQRVVFIGSPSSPLFNVSANAQLAVRITANSVNRPHVYFSLSAST